MSVEENKALERREIEQLWNKKNFTLIDEIIDDNYVGHTTVGDFKGKEGFKQFVSMITTAFPDCHGSIEDLVAEGDKIVSRVTLTGTHNGNLMEIPPTGKKISITEIAIHRIVGGKYIESWSIADMLGMMQQIGAIPSQ